MEHSTPTYSRERLLRAMRGEPVDRPPIWLREGMEPDIPLPAADDFTLGWKADPVYRDLIQYVAPHLERFAGWSAGYFNRFLMVAPEYVETWPEQPGPTPDVRITRGRIRTPTRDLAFVSEVRRGVNTGWTTEHPVKTLEDLRALFETPFSVDPDRIAAARRNYEVAKKTLGGRGLLRLGLSSPVVMISGAMPFDMFLELSSADPVFMHEMLGELTRRIVEVLDALFADHLLDTTANIGGAEQCTPPIMAPEAFDEYVVPYETPIVARLHRYGVLVNGHCHGKVAHALKGMLEIGYDATDPVEPPPAGDCNLAEARAIVGDRLTLVGNLEFSELEHAGSAHIRQRAREILDAGPRRLIVGASAGPISAVSRQLADNYRVFVDAVLENA